jgi:Cu-processing system permease protein
VRALAVARFTLAEAVSRKLVLAGVLLSVAFVGLYAVGFSFLYAEITAEGGGEDAIVAPTILAVLGLYAVHFLGGLLALFLSVGAVSSDVDTGTLHAALARPLARWEHLLGRWLALSGIVVVYVVVMSGALLAIAGAIADYRAAAPVGAVALLVLEALVLVTLSLFGSTFLSTLANGVVVFSLFGLAWLGGVVEFVGDLVANAAMTNLGVAVSLLIPSDAVWRGASYLLQPPAVTALLRADDAGLPFAGTAPIAPTMLLWALAYLAACLAGAFAVFRRRDL